ncbi:MAG: NIPSNAP family protein [Acidimicrobiales bacterium]
MLYELRIYTAMPTRLPELLARFRNHTVELFAKHGIRNVGYWTNSVGGRNDELWYIVAFEDMAHRERAWTAFASDPEWLEVRAESEKDGPLLHHLENRFLSPTDFSPLN